MGKVYKRKNNLIIFNNRGFTLLEILATFVLVAIIIPVAMEGISLSTKMASNSKHKIVAGALAEKKLTEILITRDWVNGDQKGNFGVDYNDYDWRFEVLDWEGEELIRQIDLYVEWVSSGKNRSVVISTLAYLDGN
ncbi:type II secretion system protein [Thermodesulfobacteriota bacterium]